MKFSLVLLVALAASNVAAANKRVNASGHVQHLIRNGQLPARGVNLGGWLVAENWINYADEIWAGVDPQICGQGEMALMRALGHGTGDPRFENHWNTFYTEADIQEMANYGLNTVRVPIGYWIIGYDNHDPSNQQEWKTFAPGGLKYLDRLINEWAPRHNIAVLVSIHAAKGSQNGQDHSAPSDYNHVYWSAYPENVDNTEEVATFLAERYRNSEAFLGLNLLNEPNNGADAGVVKDYYQRVYDKIRGSGNNCILVNSPLLNEQRPGAPNYWETLSPSPPYTNVWHDWHKYLIWGFEGYDAQWIITNGVDTVRNDIAGWNGNPLFMGEWSLASSAQFTDDLLRQYAVNMFGTLKAVQSGWTFWTWKQGYGNRGDGGGGWSLRDLLRDGIVDPSMWN